MAEPPDVDALAAALRRDSADLNLYVAVLAAHLADALPSGTVRVERRRSVVERMAGREGRVTTLDVALGERRLLLRMDREGRASGEVRHEVRGIVLSRRPVGLDEWIDALARSLSEAATANARAREAAERFLS
ncbi:hypothetical protein AB0D46_26365 [Streptomyces sp. NPDC048383]|uniref:hypothetical protein n=1 Tax=Streptomyces sp. NPDC048383 TaxID=3155386 RepID=UPI00343FD139